MAYKLLAGDCSFTESEDGQQGRIVLVTSSAGAISILPTIGAGYNFMGVNASLCILRGIERTYLDRDASTLRYNLSYSSGKGGSPAQKKTPEDRKWDFSNEVLSVPRPSGWVWADAGTVISQGEVSIAKRTALVGFSMTTADLDASGNTAFKAAIMACGGRINDDTFDGWGKGNVMCDGASGGTFRDSTGALRYRYDVKFTVRIIPDKATEGWQYLLKQDGVWDMPKQGTKFLCEYASFASLIP